MLSRYSLIAAAALAIAGAASAEPAKPEVREAAKPTERPAAVILASAEQVPASAPIAEGEAPAPVKPRRAARVTSCRCAGQNNR